MKNTIKQISLMAFGSVAWLVCAVALPMNQATDTDGLMAKVSNLLITQAYASDDESKSDDDDKSKDSESKSDDEDKSKDESSSTSYDTSSLVCISKTTVETTLSSSESKDSESKSDDEDKSKDDESKSDDEGKSDDSSKSDDDGKVTVCHVPPGNEDNPQTLSVDASAVDAHLTEHAGDALGACTESDDDKSKDDESKSDEDKSKDSESKSDDSSTSTSTTSLKTCKAIDDNGAAVDGYWIPEGTENDSDALNDYIAGGNPPSNPDSSMESYREIRGE